MALERIVLNIIPDGEMPVFHCSQYENGRPVIIDLVSSDDDAFLVPEGATVELHCRKVDDNIVTLEPDEVDQNTVTFVSTEQLTACPGDNLCEVVLYADTDPVQTIATLNFILHVEPDPLEGGLTSDTQIHNLTEQIEEITQQVIGDDYYNKTEVDGLLAGKADQATTYTKSEVDTALNLKADKSDTYTKTQVDTALALKANTSDLATVATTGDYDDLLNKPTIPAAQVQSDYAQADNTQVDYIKNKPDINAMIANALLAVMPVGTASGPIANFDTELAVPLVNVSCDIVATGGNGTPDNPNPINGYTEANITRCGVNLGELAETNKYDQQGSSTVYENHGVNITASAAYARTSYEFKVKKGVQYTISFYGSGTANFINVYFNDEITWGAQSYGRILLNSTLTKYTKTITATSDVLFVGFYLTTTSTSGDMVIEDFMIEVGASASDTYHVYNGQTYTIAFGQTVYGGVLDVTRGKLHVTHANIASYNGESINEPWLSSKDVYTPGGTPTTGAQVVYPLTTPFDIDLTPEVISAIVGVNNVYSDTNGDTTVQYKDSIQHYIDSRV